MLWRPTYWKREPWDTWNKKPPGVKAMYKRLDQNARRLGKQMTENDKSHCTLMALLDLVTPDVTRELENLKDVAEKLADRASTLALWIDKELAYIHVKKPLHGLDERVVDIEPQTLRIG